MSSGQEPLHLPFLWAPLLAGFNAAFLALLLLAAPDAGLLILRGAPDALAAAIYQSSLLALGALSYALLFQLLYSMIRLAAALASHLERISSRVAPGLAAFFLIGSPSLDLALRHLPADEALGASLAALVALALSFLAGALLVGVLPQLRGYNSVFLLFSALLARILLLPQAHAVAVGDLSDFAILLFGLLLAAFLLFANLQIRYRLQLSPNYERLLVTPPLLAGGAALAASAAMLWMLERLWTASSQPSAAFDGVYFGGDARQGLPGVFFILMLNQWSLSAFALYRHRLPTLARQRAALRGSALLTAAALAAASISVLIVMLHPSPSRALGGIATGRGAASELVSAIGYLLDRDRDGNSAWPGRDPDDANPCVRADFRDRCQIEGQSTPPSGPVSQLAQQEPDTTASGNLILLTMSQCSLPQTQSGGLNGERSARFFPLLAPSDQSRRSLRALFQGIDGVDERRGIKGPSIFTELSSRGYRTICTVPDSPDWRGSQLDGGCQVTESRSDSSDETLAAASSHALEMLEAYGEKHNVLWMHYEGAATESQVAQAIEQLSQRAPVLAVAGLGGRQIRSQAFLYGGGRGLATPDFPLFRDLMLAALSQRSSVASARLQLGALSSEPFTDSWTGQWLRNAEPNYPLFPIYTYRLRGDRVVLFDGLTGAEWEERSAVTAPSER
ncbi:MAG: hypothetical protein K1X75_11650 [Leptospirales bacterium]|nr:hypothetical protein [Leptospirales bacterium]